MKILQCVVADDEPIARQILEGYIDEIPYLNLVASCKNAFEVIEILQKHEIDLLFLDINMPKLSGLSLLKTIRQKPAVIITTAYSEYAVEGFELSVTDYLLKPFSLERFLQAISKVERRAKTVDQSLVLEQREASKSIFVKSDKKLLRIDLESVSHIEAYGNYIKVHADKMILTPQKLSGFLERLPDNFVQIHKSFVINFGHLKLIDGNRIVLQNEVILPLGKSHRQSVLEKIAGM